jgi:hypothetical protein
LGILFITGFIPPTSLEPIEFFGIWFGLGLVTDVWFGFRSRKLLLERFRLCAEQQFLGTTAGWLDHLFRRAGKAYGRARARPTA